MISIVLSCFVMTVFFLLHSIGKVQNLNHQMGQISRLKQLLMARSLQLNLVHIKLQRQEHKLQAHLLSLKIWPTVTLRNCPLLQRQRLTPHRYVKGWAYILSTSMCYCHFLCETGGFTTDHFLHNSGFLSDLDQTCIS